MLFFGLWTTNNNIYRDSLFIQNYFLRKYLKLCYLEDNSISSNFGPITLRKFKTNVNIKSCFYE